MPGWPARRLGQNLGFRMRMARPVCFALVHPESTMAIVAVYEFRAKFRSHFDPMDAPPAVGLSRRGMLMLKQETDARSDADAIAACLRHAAFDAVIESYALLNLVLLHKPQNKDFLPLYERAQREGSSLTYYPNSAPADEAPTVTQWGFKPQDGR